MQPSLCISLKCRYKFDSQLSENPLCQLYKCLTVILLPVYRLHVPDSLSIWVTLLFCCCPISVSKRSRNLNIWWIDSFVQGVLGQCEQLLYQPCGLPCCCDQGYLRSPQPSILWCTSIQGFWGFYCAICNPVRCITAQCAFVGAAEEWGLLCGLFHCKGRSFVGRVIVEISQPCGRFFCIFL